MSEPHMRQVLALAGEALDQGELPIAAMVVLDGEVISRAATSERRERRFLVHAEYAALEAAERQHLSFDQRARCTLYTNLEPCLMCMGAAMSFFLGRVVYGLESPSDGAVELVRSWARREEDFPGYRIPEVIGGVLREKSRRLFRAYVDRSEPGPMRDWAESLATLG